MTRFVSVVYMFGTAAVLYHALKSLATMQSLCELHDCITAEQWHRTNPFSNYCWEWDDRDYQNLSCYFMILFSMMFNVFLLCYIGQTLTEQCKKVGEVVYMTNWYFLPRRCILDLRMIIVRSSVMIKITASKMFHMSVYTFGQIMKSSFAYFNLLRQAV